MRPRNGILEIFSTFLQFEADRPSQWATDTKLRRSMQRCLEQSKKTEMSVNFWALYWYKLWSPTPLVEGTPTHSTNLAEAHLSAHLQEACYWAAHRNKMQFSTAQYTLSDCFQVAIGQVTKILKGFNPQQGFSLETYAGAIFTGAIRETLRQQRQVDVCTNWGLLRKVSQKRLMEALRTAGFGEATIAQYVLAWTGFKLLYVPTQVAANRKLPKPEPETWQAIAAFYNRERRNLAASLPETTPDLLEKWLSTCAQAARAYLNPSFVSINAPKGGEDGGEFLDDLPESPRESLLTEMITQEEQQTRRDQQIELNTLLEKTLAGFDLPTRSLLEMYYGQALTQQQMAAQLEMKQYTVSRRLSRAREMLLAAMVRWSQEVLHISLTTDLLSYTNTALEEWLQRHYHPIPDPATME